MVKGSVFRLRSCGRSLLSQANIFAARTPRFTFGEWLALAQKTREIVAFRPDAIYLKDQGGLLTVDRARTLLPVLVKNADGVPVELHSHCTTGLAPLVYLEALKLGIARLHTAVPPLANGSGQPSIFNVALNARLMGYTPHADRAAAGLGAPHL